MLIAVKEYAANIGVSPSTVQRRLNRGELKGRRFGRVWYVEIAAVERELPINQPIENTKINSQPPAVATPQLEQLIAFSSKALNSYLMMSDRLLVEKEKAYQEKSQLLLAEQQRVAELKSYVVMLEKLLFDDRAHSPFARKVSGLLPADSFQGSASAASMDDGVDENIPQNYNDPQAAS